MSFKTKIITTAINWTPTKLIIWIANIILKGIAELSDFNLDLDARKIYVQMQLVGEAEMIEVWLEDFAIFHEEESYKFILPLAKSNRIWLDNIFAHIIGKAFKIPMLPQIAPHIGLIAELLKPNNPEGDGEG
ncbi:MAG: hypothetical protein ABL903_00630 [Methylococcales bacterium]